jgi:hypothetical protein
MPSAMSALLDGWDEDALKRKEARDTFISAAVRVARKEALLRIAGETSVEDAIECRMAERIKDNAQMWLESDALALMVNKGAVLDADLDEQTLELISSAAFQKPETIGPGALGHPKLHLATVASSYQAHRWAEMRDGMGSRADALLRRMDESGRLETLKAAGRLAEWMRVCVADGNAQAAKRALDAGASLSGLSQEEARLLFTSACGAPGGARLDQGVARKREAWALAIAAGVQKIEWPAECSLGEAKGWSQRANRSAIGPLAEEARRGGSLRGVGRHAWLRAAFLLRRWPDGLAEAMGANASASPLAWAMGQGLDAKTVKARDVARATLGCVARALEEHTGHCVSQALRELRAAGSRLDEGPRAKGDEEPNCLATAIDEGLANHVLRELLLSGASVERVGHDGKTILQTAMEKTGPTAAKRAVELLTTLEQALPGSMKKAFEAPGSKGSGPIHWAAKSLQTSMLELARSGKADIHALDKDGNGAGHWAAARYGSKSAQKALKTIEWLQRHGYDWSVANKRGDSAALALSRRGGAERAMAVINLAPQTAEAANKKGLNALEALSDRNPKWRSEVEETLLKHVLAESSAKAKAAKDAAGRGPGSDTTGESGAAARKKPRRM